MDREPWGEDSAEPWIPDPTGEEYHEYHESREELRQEDEERDYWRPEDEEEEEHDDRS